MNQPELIREEPFAQLTPPYVSIIIPVYNVEKNLPACLISAVFQTLPEIEVIVVNDASPDNSQAIIDDFVARFPDKVRSVIHEQNQGLAYARRTGLRHARAPYVVFLDSDDLISSILCETMLKLIREKDLDMVYFPSLRCWEGTQKTNIMPQSQETDQVSMIKNGSAAFYSAIYRREFLAENEDVAFVKRMFEDAAATPVLMSRTDKIGVYNERIMYYYRYGRTGSICTQKINEEKMDDLLAADFTSLERMKGELEEAGMYRSLKRAAVTLGKEVSIYDYNVFHIKQLAEMVGDRTIILPDNFQRPLEQALCQPDEICIPKRVYVNGFMRSELKDFARYLEQARRSYLFDPEVVILDETTCDTQLLPTWLKNAAPEEKGLYFAVRHIRERGGVYISPAVQVVTSFNREAFRGAFFVAGPDTTVLPCAFGAAPDNPLMMKLLEQLERENTAWSRECAADVMARVLVGEGGVHLNGSSEYGRCGLHMLSFSDVVRRENTTKSYCVLNYSNYAGTADNMLCLPEDLNDFAWVLAAQRS